MEVIYMEVIVERRGRYKRRLWRLFRLYFRLLLLFLIFSSTCATILLSYTKWQGAPSLHVPKATIFYGVDHSEIGERHYGERRYWVDLANISPHVVQAT